MGKSTNFGCTNHATMDDSKTKKYKPISPVLCEAIIKQCEAWGKKFREDLDNVIVYKDGGK